jgi:hypothetical protein
MLECGYNTLNPIIYNNWNSVGNHFGITQFLKFPDFRLPRHQKPVAACFGNHFRNIPAKCILCFPTRKLFGSPVKSCDFPLFIQGYNSVVRKVENNF